MKTCFALAGLFLVLLPSALPAAPSQTHPIKAASKAAKTAMLYECSKCHMKVSAATAKKDGYKDSMDGGTFIPVKTAKK